MNIKIGILNVPKQGNKHDLIHFVTQFSVTVVRCRFTMDALSSQNLNVRLWICPKCEFFNFSDCFFFSSDDQLKLETQNRFDPLTKGTKPGSSSFGRSKNNFIGGLKFVSININSIGGKKLELLAFLDFHQPHVVAIQETNIDSSIVTSKLFPESCQYNVFRKDRTLHGGGVMLLVHKDISHMPIMELENYSE